MKKYTLTLEDADGKLTVKSECDGFNPLELMGLLYWKAWDIREQAFGKIQPDIVERKLVKEPKEGTGTNG
jgi:hypothetical protein